MRKVRQEEAGKEGCRKAGVQERRDEGKEVFKR